MISIFERHRKFELSISGYGPEAAHSKLVMLWSKHWLTQAYVTKPDYINATGYIKMSYSIEWMYLI